MIDTPVGLPVLPCMAFSTCILCNETTEGMPFIPVEVLEALLKNNVENVKLLRLTLFVSVEVYSIPGYYSATPRNDARR